MKKCFEIKTLLVLLVCLLCIPALSRADEQSLKVRLHLDTSAEQRILVKGSFKGDFTDYERVESMILIFGGLFPPSSTFQFAGPGGFVSVRGIPLQNRKAIRDTIFKLAQSYLITSRQFGLTNSATVVGTLTKAKKSRFICSSFGGFLPNSLISTGRYFLNLTGLDIEGKIILQASGEVDLSNFIR